MAYRVCFRGVSSLPLCVVASPSSSPRVAIAASSGLLTLRTHGARAPAVASASVVPARVALFKALYSTSRDPPVANPEERPRGSSIARDKKKATHEWNENLASRSEAIVKAERMPNKDIAEMQRETASQRTEAEKRNTSRRASRSTHAHGEQQQTVYAQEERVEFEEKTSIVRRVPSPDQSM